MATPFKEADWYHREPNLAPWRRAFPHGKTHQGIDCDRHPEKECMRLIIGPDEKGKRWAIDFLSFQGSADALEEDNMLMTMEMVDDAFQDALDILCECGRGLTVFVWSFAGSGRICPGCDKLLQGTI